MRTIRSLILCILVFSISCVSAQVSSSFKVLRFDVKDQIQGTSLYGLNQDDSGFIWVGTSRGLLRFDGATFEPFHTSVIDQRSVVERIYMLDNDRKLVLSAYPRGLFLQRGEGCIPLDVKLPGTPGIKFSQSTTDGSLIFWNGNEITRIDPTSLKSSYVWRDTNSEFKQYRGIYGFNRDSFFASTNYSAFIHGKHSHTKFDELVGATCVLRQGNDRLVAFVEDRIYSVHKSNVTLLGTIPDKAVRVLHAVFDLKGNIWFSGNNHGLYIMQNGEVKEVTEALNIKGEMVTHLLVDNAGNVWVSTAASGLQCVIESPFTNFTIRDGLSSNHITSLCQWGNAVLIGTNSGLNEISSNRVRGVDQLGMELKKPLGPAIYGYIHHLNGGRERLFVSSNSVKHDPEHPRTGTFQAISSSASLLWKDTLILGRWGGVTSRSVRNMYHIFNHVVVRKSHFKKEFFMHRLRNGKIIIGTEAGLFMTDLGVTFVSRVNVPGDSGIIYYDVAVAPDSSLWFATSSGVTHWSEDGTWEMLEADDGLGDDIIKALDFDSEGGLWLGTGLGLALYRDGRFVTYTEGNGLVHNSVTSVLYVRDKNELWIGTFKGLSRLDLNKLKINSGLSAPLKITSVDVLGEGVYDVGHLPNLNWKQNNLSIHFAPVRYSPPSDVVYQYRIKPGNPDWQTTTRSKIDFFALAPDQYTFEVRSKVSGKQWGTPTAIQLNIMPPVWRRTGFVIPALLLFVLMTFIYLRIRVRTIQRREHRNQAYQQEINQLEQQALSLSMNPHFIFNSLNSIQHYFGYNSSREANEFIADFAELIRLTMETSTRGHVPLMDEIHRLTLYLSLEKSRFERKLTFTIDVDQELKDANPFVPGMIIQPIVENAIWHGILPSGNPGVITVRVRGVHPIEVIIEDNGIGLEAARIRNAKAHRHESRGIEITLRRLKFLSEKNELHVEEIFDDQGNSLGTRAQILIWSN